MGRYYSRTYPRIESLVFEHYQNNYGDFKDIFQVTVDPNTIYGKIVNVSNLMDAYRKSMRGSTKYKRGSVSFNNNLLPNLASIYARLVHELYFPYRYDRFVLNDGKARLIDVPPHSDKIVHHMINNVLLDYFTNIFIKDSYACIKGRGNQKAVERLKVLRKRAMKEYGENCYFLKLDISKFFHNINQDILKYIIRKYIPCFSTCNLLERIIYGYPEEKGLPLGNLISQLFANIYMHEFDIYCKKDLNIPFYLRYADDIFIFVKNHTTAKDILNKCINFASNNLKLVINPQKCYISKPSRISGLGYVFTNKGLKTKGKSLRHFKEFAHNYDLKRMNSWYITAAKGHVYTFIKRQIADKNIEFNPNDKVPFKIKTMTEEVLDDTLIDFLEIGTYDNLIY